MKWNRSLATIVAVAGFALAGAQRPAMAAVAADDSLPPGCPPQNDVWGFCIAYDFNTFLYYLLLIQTNDTSEPADVNNVYIASNYDDDPDGFNRVFLLP